MNQQHMKEHNMSDYHVKKYPVLFTCRMSAAQHKRLLAKAKKQGLNASEWVRKQTDETNTNS